MKLFRSINLTVLIIAFCVFWGGIVLLNLGKELIMGYFLSHYQFPPVTVSSVKVQEKTWQPYLHSVGNFVATRGVEVNSQSSGNVVNVHFESGQPIEANQPLIDLDDSIEQSTLKFNEAELQLKSINYQRLNALFKRNATSSSSLDEAKASLEQATANVDKIKTEITHKHIVAPFSGQLGIRQVNLGEYVTAGQTHIVTLQTLNPLYIHFYIPEQYDKRLHPGQSVWVRVQEYPQLRFASQITAISPKVDPETHNLLVQATMDNCPLDFVNHPSKKIKFDKVPNQSYSLVHCHSSVSNTNQRFAILPGMFASLAVALPPREHTMVLPSTAISYSLYGNAVYLIEPSPNQEKSDQGKPIYQVKRVFVQTGDQQGNETIILSGLKPGDEVVSAGELKLQNGTHVVINNDIQLKAEPDFDQLGQ